MHQEHQGKRRSRSSSISNKVGKDWRTTDALSPVRDQEEGKCCFAFVVCGALEASYYIMKKERILLSPQDLYNNLIHNEEEDDNGVSIPTTLSWVRDNGCILEEACPYTGVYKTCDYERKIRLRVGATMQISADNPQRIEAEVRKQPLPAQVFWCNALQKLEKDAIYSGPEEKSGFEGEDTGMHGVLLVGFGELTKGRERTKYWIVQNSHGTEWCDGGFGKISTAKCHERYLLEAVWVPGLTDKDGNDIEQ